MKKNEIFNPVMPKDRNELIDAIEQKQKVIYIEGELFKDVIEQLNGDVSKRKSVKWLIGGGFATAYAALFIPVVGGVVSAIMLILYGFLAAAGIVTRDLKEYNIGFSGGKNVKTCKRIILVHKDYSFQYDSVEDDIILSNDAKRCPKCKNKIKNNYCSSCEKQIVFINKVKHKLKDNIDGDKK